MMETYFEMVEDYVLGTLSPQNKTAFEDALQKDEALSAYLRQFQEMQQRLEIYRIRSGVHTALKESPQQQQLKVGWRTNRIFWAAAASIALLITSVWIIFKPTSSIDQNQYTLTSPTTPTSPTTQTDHPTDPQPTNDVQQHPGNTPAAAKGNDKIRLIALANTYYTAPSGTGFRAISDNPGPAQKSPVQLAIAAFELKKYAEAARLLKADSLVVNDELARYVRAHARYKTAQFTSASHDFEALKDSFQYQYEARWNLLLCWVAMGKGKDAETQKLLSEIVGDPDFPYRQKALQLADKLQSI